MYKKKNCFFFLFEITVLDKILKSVTLRLMERPGLLLFLWLLSLLRKVSLSNLTWPLWDDLDLDLDLESEDSRDFDLEFDLERGARPSILSLFRLFWRSLDSIELSICSIWCKSWDFFLSLLGLCLKDVDESLCFSFCWICSCIIFCNLFSSFFSIFSCRSNLSIFRLIYTSSTLMYRLSIVGRSKSLNLECNSF